MNRFRPTCRSALWLLLAAGLGAGGTATAASAPNDNMVPAARRAPADAVQVDRPDPALAARLQRVDALAAAGQWDEAVDILVHASESADGILWPETSRRYVDLADWCRRRLASFPTEALQPFRRRSDPTAKQWYEQGVAERNPALLRRVVRQAPAGSYARDALLALGDMAFETGDFSAARADWESAASPASQHAAPPSENVERPPSAVEHPFSRPGAAMLQSRLTMASILEGNFDRAEAELAQLAKLYPDARGRLGGREGKYADLLKDLLAESASWPAPSPPADWPTPAGNAARNQRAAPLDDIGAVIWRIPLAPSENAAPSPSGNGAQPPSAVRDAFSRPGAAAPHSRPGAAVLHKAAVPHHPIHVGGLIFWNDSQRVYAARMRDGRPAWGRNWMFFDGGSSDLPAAAPLPDARGTPRFTLTAHRGRLFARLGSPWATSGDRAAASESPGYLACFDLAAQGRLLWQFTPDDGLTLDGSPAVDDCGVYVAMRQGGLRPRVFVARLDAETGRPQWQRFVCGAETPGRGALPEGSHNLLTPAGGRLYYNTNLGAVAALATDDGRIPWLVLSPCDRRGDAAELPLHWGRALTPCVFDRGAVFAAPTDCRKIFALDAASGQTLWQTGDDVEDALDPLGVVGDCLIAGGRRLYWIGLSGAERGRVKHVWPDGPERPGVGRGLLAGDDVLFPTRDRLHVFDARSARPKKVFDLAALGASGGNLLSASGRLLIASDRELIALGPAPAAMPSEKETATMEGDNASNSRRLTASGRRIDEE